MPRQQTDIAIIGATPGGIGAALAAARRGRKTLLIEPGPYIGGLMTSGLGVTDIHSLDAAGSIFREYAEKVLHYYTETYGADSEQVVHCRKGLRFEPSVGKKILLEMIAAEPQLQVLCLHEVTSAQTEGQALRSITVRPVGEQIGFTVEAAVFIDATYEGDLAAMSGVTYSLGRESRDEWNEQYAGVLYQVFRSKQVLPGSTGEGDERIQAYNFRLCLTNRDDNRVPFRRPLQYHREDYASLIEDVSAGRIATIRDAINIVQIPNGKSDTNNHHYSMCSTDLPEENGNYPEGTREQRQQIIARHKQYIEGLLWFLQHDEQLPEAFRLDALQWGYAADEFTDTEHFPPQIYVREARRIHGEYTFTENDARLAPGLGRSPIHYDSIACGDYGIDSHATQKRNDIGGHQSLEGFMAIGWLTEIYQVPYGAIVPRTVDNLLVPVAVSATHMGLGTIRMEPCWMQLGFAAGVAADVSLAAHTTVRKLSIDRLHDELLRDKQVVMYFKDVNLQSEQGQAAQYFGAKGWLTDYNARLDEPVTVAEASLWISQARTFDGGRGLACLPAVNELLPAGQDMGPYDPKQDDEPPRTYWRAHPLLLRTSAIRWAAAAAKSLSVEPVSLAAATSQTVQRGEFLSVLYAMLKQSRIQ